MSNGSGVYVLCSDPCDHSLSGCSCYVSHGTFRGESDVVSSGTLRQAKFFAAKEAAEAYLQAELPLWARGKYQAMKVPGYRLASSAPQRYAEFLQHGNFIQGADLL